MPNASVICIEEYYSGSYLFFIQVFSRPNFTASSFAFHFMQHTPSAISASLALNYALLSDIVCKLKKK